MSKSSKQPTRVLFIGNSFTARNDLPELIAQLALLRAAWRWITSFPNIGALRFCTHWNKGAARERAIQTGKFDDVNVLQEQSTLPIKNARHGARMRPAVP